MKNKKIIILLLFISFVLSACGKKAEIKVEDKTPTTPVTTQAVRNSLSIKRDLNYPGVVSAESEAKVVAKSSGTLTAIKFKVGDKVSLGQQLAKIDDINNAKVLSGGELNSSQIKQAKLGVEQALGAFQLSKNNYENLLISSVKDLRQAEISRDQAAKGETNLTITTGESVKSAELAYETAKLAVAQASLSLENRTKQANQGSIDVKQNASLAIQSGIASISSLITNINNITAFDDNNSVTINYRSNLGALDSSVYDSAKKAYQKLKEEYAKYDSLKFSSISEQVSSVLVLSTLAQNLAEETKLLFDKTITSASLPQTSVGGSSLSGLQAAAAGYQVQMNAVASQINGASQALTNTALNNDSLLDSLKQGLDLAKKQEASALQNLNNLKAGNVSQKDQAIFVYSLAQNQYDNLKVKIESQVSGARTQMETARLQYDNALVSLQSLYDTRSVIAPLDGTITQVFASDSETVAPGQPILVISQTDNIKVNFYVEADNLLAMNPGLPVSVVDEKGKEYPGVISGTSLQADTVTRRFLVEVKMENAEDLFLGTIVNIKVAVEKKADQGFYILPLSAVNISQNDSYIFIVDNNKAKKINIEVGEVSGGLAIIKADLSYNDLIIIEGNKLITDGQDINIQN